MEWICCRRCERLKCQQANASGVCVEEYNFWLVSAYQEPLEAELKQTDCKQWYFLSLNTQLNLSYLQHNSKILYISGNHRAFVSQKFALPMRFFYPFWLRSLTWFWLSGVLELITTARAENISLRLNNPSLSDVEHSLLLNSVSQYLQFQRSLINDVKSLVLLSLILIYYV